MENAGDTVFTMRTMRCTSCASVRHDQHWSHADNKLDLTKNNMRGDYDSINHIPLNTEAIINEENII